MDVKYVPTACYSGTVPQKFYQYTVIDEASRERFIYPYMEQSSYSTTDFLRRAISYFGYQPQILQTDNGAEFTHVKKLTEHTLLTSCAANWESFTKESAHAHLDIMERSNAAIATIRNDFIITFPFMTTTI